MLIVLTGLQPTLWFADVRGDSSVQQYRKFLFARVVYAGKPLLCAMCVIVRRDIQHSWHSPRLVESGFIVRELGLGLTPVRYTGVVTGSSFETVRTAQAYAITWAWRTLASPGAQESMLHVVDMYDAANYKNWEPVCL